jgi:hypothetical protein
VVNGPAGRLKLSGDGRYLYVAIEGNRRILRLDLTGADPDLEIDLGSTDFGFLLFAEDFEVVPGQPHSLGVLRAYGMPPSLERVHSDFAIYDDGVPRSGLR